MQLEKTLQTDIFCTYTSLPSKQWSQDHTKHDSSTVRREGEQRRTKNRPVRNTFCRFVITSPTWAPEKWEPSDSRTRMSCFLFLRELFFFSNSFRGPIMWIYCRNRHGSYRKFVPSSKSLTPYIRWKLIFLRCPSSVPIRTAHTHTYFECNTFSRFSTRKEMTNQFIKTQVTRIRNAYILCMHLPWTFQRLLSLYVHINLS